MNLQKLDNKELHDRDVEGSGAIFWAGWTFTFFVGLSTTLAGIYLGRVDAQPIWTAALVVGGAIIGLCLLAAVRMGTRE